MPLWRMGEWKYSSTILKLGHQIEVSGRFHAPSALHPGEIVPRTHYWEDRVDPRPDLDSKTKRKFSYSYREQNPDSSFVHPTV
jgi:hypothetical protein